MARVFTPARVLSVFAVLVLLLAAVVVLLVNGSSSSNCVGGHSSNAFGPVPALSGLSSIGANISLTTLPASRDNDAGRSRVPDVTPDADNDVYRARVVCSAP